jgi:uncharacterized protein YbjT (DUF2867 family)
VTAQRREKALVVGATSRIGQDCIRRLLELDYHVTYTVARKWEMPFAAAFKDDLVARKLNLENIEYFKIERWMESFDLAIIIPPIYLSQNILPYAKAAGVKRLVFVSSYNTYRFGHTAAYAPLKAAEIAISSSALDTVIIQPTMIIGHAQCSATRMILEKARRGQAFYGVNGRPALQQPIDFRDLAAALIKAGTDNRIESGRYPVSGQDILSSRELYTGVSQLIEKPARFIILPKFMTSTATKIISALSPNSDAAAYLTRLGENRHSVHDTLPNWTADFSLSDSLENLRQELQAKA